ncbi:MAG: M20/M25/M40 family metallo-hydrolase, partial [Spirochaetales bacterium]|nr:M20/M25/M40 family metallo-hydrolase [Candidatus Physcosoma equi]
MTEREQLLAYKLSRMIQCETISEKGKPNAEKFEAFQKVLAELFPNVFSKAEVIHIDSSLLIKWKGQGKAEPMLLMSHQDVVPAEGEWKYPPFSGKIAEGRVWGRGTVDTKGPLMCILQSMEELIAENYIPQGDFYIASSSTEEVAGDGAPKTVEYLKKHGVHLQFLMDEGGMIVDEPMPGIKARCGMIGTVEKGTGNIRIVAHSNGGHASAPSKNSPIARLSAFVEDIEKHNPNKAELSPTLLEMFSRLGPYAKGVLGFAMRNAKVLTPLLKAVLPAVSDKGAAMIRTTMAFTMSGGSAAPNVLPETAWININTRFIQHQGVEKTAE